ncbi:unnamed protein product [Didymodactylos carnosus]|uniref:Uncharacterized protein n=1 Tax=Didymodactylos carnosus TaxID=1234261 RepID=A0A8S2ELY6_9BILA|nr:unnamed protein product [Didymodactylos carnosus]CAF4007922.1 unnamed protein product [Didymodactylos carnosus]
MTDSTATITNVAYWFDGATVYCSTSNGELRKYNGTMMTFPPITTHGTPYHYAQIKSISSLDIQDEYAITLDDTKQYILGKFLRHFVGERLKDIPVTTIEKLAAIVLKENAFTFNSKLYKQIIGCAMGSPFTLTLANIFMWHWEQRWIHRQKKREEIYGR